jgi:DNA gyrase inhibitor GyrI/DNA-binding HxlR family transcriptional regulator
MKDKGLRGKPADNGISASAAEDIADFLLALSHRARVKILSMLTKRNRTFRVLADATGLKKTSLSNHLLLLQERGLIVRVTHGSYSITDDGRRLFESAREAYNQSVIRRDDEERRVIERFTKLRKLHKMAKELIVEIVELEPMTVASVRAISMSPEEDALKKLVAFVKPRGFLDNLGKHPIFGFNNPNPSKPGKEYGYEFWMKVDPKAEVAGEVELKKFDGGLYAVTRCNLTQEAQSDFLREHGQLESWYRLVEWLKSSHYKMADHQCLEKALNPGATEGDWFLDLYLPIKK